MEKTKQNKFSISFTDMELTDLEEVRSTYVDTIGIKLSRNAIIKMLLFENPAFNYTANAVASSN